MLQDLPFPGLVGGWRLSPVKGPVFFGWNLGFSCNYNAARKGRPGCQQMNGPCFSFMQDLPFPGFPHVCLG